ncbi:hypothetical protein PG993_010566 [Apiospora rasikravindrae]|uniref:adenine phosphoribosyltransferase n=1 Tax=Apiospora rasikravindrae TaxID=990691 RepID=A0ABR1SP01_9PEZI
MKITKYTALERNELFANRLGNLIGHTTQSSSPLPALKIPPVIHRGPILLDSMDEQDEKYDLILFCHSMYGMQPQQKYLEKALELLAPPPAQGLAVVFHREETLNLDGLASHRTASFPDALLSIEDDDETLDSFAAFVTGSAIQNDTAIGRTIQHEWRKVCRDLGRHDNAAYRGKLMFSTPEVMKVYTQNAVPLPSPITQVPTVRESKPPLEEVPKGPKLIVLVTGECGAGKDYCANWWACVLNWQPRLRARVASISHATKREYATAFGADLNRLLYDRAYKEHHRSALTEFYEGQLREAHFLDAVREEANSEMDVLFITGMSDEAPVAAFSHLVPDSRVIEVRAQASRATREIRRRRSYLGSASRSDDYDGSNPTTVTAALTRDLPTFVFDNDATGEDESPIQAFAERNLLPYFDEDLERLRAMVCTIPDFPQSGVEFRHVLGIAQQTGGLELCTSLLQSHFNHGDWSTVNAIAVCETGGLVFASALAARVGVPLALIREEGKLPPPTLSVAKTWSSYIPSLSTDGGGISGGGEEKMGRVAMDRDAVSPGASVVVVDDVLASGATLCAALQLLGEAGVSQTDINVLVVAEFPVHRGRQLLLRRGFGGVRVQSLLVFGGN